MVLVSLVLVLLPASTAGVVTIFVILRSGAQPAVSLTLLLPLAVGAVATGLAVWASFIFARSIAAPLADFAETATRVARGDLHLTVSEDREDEVGVLARAFNSMTQQLNRRIELEQFVSDLSRRFIGLGVGETGAAIDQALAEVGSLIHADRSRLFLFSEDRLTMEGVHEWRREGLKVKPHELQDAPVFWFSWFIEGLGRRESLHVPAVSELPPEAAEEKAAWEDEGIQALVCIPLFYGGGLRAFLEFDSFNGPRIWSSEDIRFLNMVGEVIRSSLERRRIEEVLLESEEKYRSIIENAVEGIYRSTPQGRLVSVNPAMAHMFGYDSPEEMIDSVVNVRAQFFVHARERNAFIRAIREKGAVIGREFQFHRKDGSTIWALLTARLVRAGNVEGDEEAVSIEGFVRDITERKLSEEQIRRLNAELERRVTERTSELEAANKELESFSYSVSHDLRTPLRSIDGFSQALLEDYSPLLDDLGREYLLRVRKASQHMGNLIDDLLDLSRVTRGEMIRQGMDLGEVVREVIYELQQSDPQRDVTIVIGDIPPVEGDPRLVRIMLENLLGNAWKFTSRVRDARIEFGVTGGGGGLGETRNGPGLERAHGWPVYFLRDNGAGFDMAYADKLFKAFNRLHGLDEFEGTGIGLAIVERIVKRHGGLIWAESKVGEGTVFYFTL